MVGQQWGRAMTPLSHGPDAALALALGAPLACLGAALTHPLSAPVAVTLTLACAALFAALRASQEPLP